jgi:hypothetical protein
MFAGIVITLCFLLFSLVEDRYFLSVEAEVFFYINFMVQCVPQKSESYSTDQEVINLGKFHPVFCMISLLKFDSEQTLVCQYMFCTCKESDHVSQRTQSVSIWKTGR